MKQRSKSSKVERLKRNKTTFIARGLPWRLKQQRALILLTKLAVNKRQGPAWFLRAVMALASLTRAQQWMGCKGSFITLVF